MIRGTGGSNVIQGWTGRSRRFVGVLKWENAHLPMLQGQIIDETTIVTTSVRRSYAAGDSLVRTKTLYSSSFETPPERKTDPGKSNRPVRRWNR